MRILVVDDNQTYREMLRGLLAPGGYDVDVAASAAEALDMVRRVRPALVLADLYMPGGDGDELCRRIKADPASRATPVLMMSGGGRKDESARCLAAGCDDFLVKPVRQAELLLTASRHMHARLRSLRPRVRVPVLLESAGERYAGLTVDLSLGGLFLETDAALAPGTEVLLEFSLPEAGLLLVRAEVAWVNQPAAKIKKDLPVGLGMQFTKLTPEAQMALGRFIERDRTARAPTP